MRHFRLSSVAAGLLLAAVLTAPVATAQTPLPTDQVLAIQRLLAQQGYDPGPIDGRPGGKTAAAIRRYQHDHNLPMDGQLSPALLASLEGQAPAVSTAQAPPQSGTSTLGSLLRQTFQTLGLSGRGQGTSGYIQFGQNRGATRPNNPGYGSGPAPGAGASTIPQSSMNFGQAGSSRQEGSQGAPDTSSPLPPGDYLNPQACRAANDRLDAYKQQHPGEDTADFERLVERARWACATAQQCRLAAGALRDQEAERARDQYAQQHFGAKPAGGPLRLDPVEAAKEQESERAFHQACDRVLGATGSAQPQVSEQRSRTSAPAGCPPRCAGPSEGAAPSGGTARSIYGRPVITERDMPALAAKQHPGEKWGYVDFSQLDVNSLATLNGLTIKVPNTARDGEQLVVPFSNASMDPSPFWRAARGYVRRGRGKDGTDIFEVTAVLHRGLFDRLGSQRTPDLGDLQWQAKAGWLALHEMVPLVH